MPPPRADFACNSKRCRRKDGSAPVYELPTKATRCPVCGSRQIRRLYNSIRVLRGVKPDHFDGRHTSSSLAARVDAVTEVPLTAALAKRDEVSRARRRYPMVKPVPLRGLKPALDAMYAGANAQPNVAVDQRLLGQKTVLGGHLPGDAGKMVDAIQEAGMPRGATVLRDTEYKAVKRGERVEGEKA